MITPRVPGPHTLTELPVSRAHTANPTVVVYYTKVVADPCLNCERPECKHGTCKIFNDDSKVVPNREYISDEAAEQIDRMRRPAYGGFIGRK